MRSINRVLKSQYKTFQEILYLKGIKRNSSLELVSMVSTTQQQDSSRHTVRFSSLSLKFHLENIAGLVFIVKIPKEVGRYLQTLGTGLSLES